MTIIRTTSWNNGESYRFLTDRLREEGLNFKKLRRDTTYSPPTSDSILINWGRSNPVANAERYGRVLNKFDACKVASDKVRALVALKNSGVRVPLFTLHKEYAQILSNWGHSLYARTITNGHSGNGIIYIEPNTDSLGFPYAGLYTEAIQCKREYRVHVFDGRMIDLTAKVKPNGEEADGLIRNHENGWVFARDAVTIPDDIRSRLSNIGVNAVEALDLDFGAVDVVRDFEDNLFVLEVNTAPGLTSTTLEKYTEVFLNYLRS